ncbi:MAG: NADH-quinone oxidoreductase subunit A [Verrucomicrobia bacterium]|nr:NADH-quinone oxidoreductase subunit A [Verrucomicrobiota bacterium]MCF7708368.1 NADH-quinone oxidoreductase subunit A [Verrucomicrobiota bacterium]
MNILYLLTILVTGVIFVLGGFFVSRLVGPNNPNPVKREPYECGEIPFGEGWTRFNVGYYIFALLFLIFEVEVVFFFPWAVVLREIGVLGLIEGLIFLFVLFFGLIFAWRKGYLVWH